MSLWVAQEKERAAGCPQQGCFLRQDAWPPPGGSSLSEVMGNTRGTCFCPADGVGSSRQRFQSRKQQPGGGFRLQTSPQKGRSEKAHLLGPARLSPTQWLDCTLGPDVPLRAAAQKGFSAAFQWQIYAVPAGRSHCTAPALARSPAAGNVPLRAPGGEGRSVCPDTHGLSRLSWKCQKGVGSRQPEGPAAGGGQRRAGNAGNNSPWRD